MKNNKITSLNEKLTNILQAEFLITRYGDNAYLAEESIRAAVEAGTPWDEALQEFDDLIGCEVLQSISVDVDKDGNVIEAIENNIQNW